MLRVNDSLRPRQLAARSDAMVVIGGRESSNTKRLAELCRGTLSHGRLDRTGGGAGTFQPVSEGFYWNHCGRIHACVDNKGGL